ncbi:MAG: hypothetical protein V7L00_08255 [Nostoc sp.]|uniref:hypothetical protein n=1 Tax=Nostoc sp. TaxID=1180 RepID=UPI002FF73144
MKPPQVQQSLARRRQLLLPLVKRTRDKSGNRTCSTASPVLALLHRFSTRRSANASTFFFLLLKYGLAHLHTELVLKL